MPKERSNELQAQEMRIGDSFTYELLRYQYSNKFGLTPKEMAEKIVIYAIIGLSYWVILGVRPNPKLI